MISNANKPQRYITHVEVRAIQPEMIGYEESEEGMNMSGLSSSESSYVKYVPACRESAISVSTIRSNKTERSMSMKSSGSTAWSSISSLDSQGSERLKKYRFDAAPKLVKTPWEADRSKTAFARQWQGDPTSIARPTTAKSVVLSARVFKHLPDEIYDCILRQLEATHLKTEGGACVSCLHMDLYNLCLVSKAWNRRARIKLYQNIWLVADDTTVAPVKMPFVMKVKRIRKTLRDQPHLAGFVHEINASGVQQLYQQTAQHDRSIIISNLASLVMACTNLKRFTGLHIPFDHEYDRLTHALSTRRRLKEKIWMLKGIEDGWDGEGNYRTNARTIRGDGSIDNGDVFLSCHFNWPSLETLMLFGQDSGNLDYRAFVGTFRTLPSLKNLLISGFNKSQFNDRTMAALPLNLHSLRLQDLPGVTEKGLYRFIDSSVVMSLRSLSLINLDLKSARHLSRLFSFSPFLKRFTLTQSMSPDIDPARPLPKPIYQSSSLEFLHWDISPFYNPSITHLADCIQSNAFPSLRRIRVPCDDGTLQALCRPRADIARASDADTASSLTLRSSLSVARMAAQERLEAKRLEALLVVVVTDEDGLVQSNMIYRNFMGTLSSRITYVLEADVEVGGADNSGLLELEHLMSTRRGMAMEEESFVKKVTRSGTATCSGAAENGWVGIRGGFQVKHGKGHAPREKIKMVNARMFF